VAVVFDRPDERQIVFERMDWSHPNRRGYYEKNKAFISHTPALVSEVLADDPIQGDVQRQRGADASARAGAARAAGRRPDFRGGHRVRAARFSLVDVNAAGCSKGTTLARWASHGA
jgi:hypothetical protein